MDLALGGDAMASTPHRLSARPHSKGAAFFRLLGALLCLGGALVAVATEAFVILNQAAIEQSQYAACVASNPFPGVAPLSRVVAGPQRDLFLAPAVTVLVVVGARTLVRKAPGIAPPAAMLLILGGTFVWFIQGFSFVGLLDRGPIVCPIVLVGSGQLVFWLGLLAGLIGSIMLSHTTRYRPVQDA
jgi:hypothetical protein